MRIDYFIQLIKIVECKSIRKAAVELNVSQPALSISMKNFEKQMGFKIFDKVGRTLVLTPRGEELYRSAKRIQQEIHIVDELKNQWGSRYYLSVANNFSILAKDAIIDLYGKYSKEKINIKIEDASITSTVYNVSKGISEIGVIRFPVYKKSILNQILTMENLEYCALARENACVVVGKNNSLYHIENNTIAMEHLKNCRFATYVSETTDNIWMNFLQELGIDYRNIALANVGHLMAAIRKTDLAFIDTKKDHTHNSWYEDIRYIEIEPPVVCELGYIHKKAVDISEIGEEYLSILKKRICAWKNMVVEN